MKVLWLSNAVLSAGDKGVSGTWLDAMAQRLAASSRLMLSNIVTGNVSEPVSRNSPSIQQWLVPSSPPGKNGLPCRKTVEMVTRTIETQAPDLIHVWGVETWWGLLAARQLLNPSVPVLLEIQGLKGACARVFAGGMTVSEQRNCRYLKEMLLGRSFVKDRKELLEWGRFEQEIIAGCRFISTQSPWVASWVQAANPDCTRFDVELMLRQAFYDSTPWSPASPEPVIFCSSAYSVPYKGLHDAIRAVALLSRRFPEIRLRIAGSIQKSSFRQDGYVRWLNNLCTELGIANRVDWLGPLTADQIVREIQNCSAFVMPSHCESYCVALAEALYLGCPAVTAYTGGTAWLASDEVTGLFYPPGDEAMCARQLERILTNRELASRLSCNARTGAQERNNPDSIIANQLDIYRRTIAKSSD